eukprot:762668-Hanusia_phi.AAC.2
MLARFALSTPLLSPLLLLLLLLSFPSSYDSSVAVRFCLRPAAPADAESELAQMLDAEILETSRALLLQAERWTVELTRPRRRRRRRREESMATLRKRNEKLREEREDALEMLRHTFACKVRRVRGRKRERGSEGRGDDAVFVMDLSDLLCQELLRCVPSLSARPCLLRLFTSTPDLSLLHADDSRKFAAFSVCELIELKHKLQHRPPPPPPPLSR